MRLGEISWCALPDRPLLCVPVGSCEQHGPHLPMATDTIVAEAVADGFAAGRADVIVAPPVTVSASGEHAGFRGTLSTGTATTTDTLVELARSADWATGVVLVNGHGGNREAVDAAVATATAEGRRVLAWWPHVPDGDAHAGRTETSLLLALRPDLVHAERAERGVTEPVAILAGRLRAAGVRAVSPNGVLGDPTGATAEEGRTLLAGLVDDLAAAVAGWQ